MATESNTEYGFNEQNTDTESVKCNSCGANMIFDAEVQVLYCPHCGSKKELTQNAMASEINFGEGLSGDSRWREEETSVFSCDNCGAKVVLTKNETAKHCPFCGTAHVRKSEELAGLKPNAVLPFRLGVDSAVACSKQWAKKRFYAPNKFKKNLSAQNVSGVYAPCFTFDSYTSSTYYGRIGKTYTRTVGSGKNRRTETYTVWRNISGSHYDNFNDVLITAGSKLGQNQLDRIAPYNTEQSKLYSEEYLLGFMAYHYDSGIDDCWSNAKGVMDRAIERGILSQYNYDKVDFLNVSTQHQNVTYKYVMLPIYVGNFSFKKKLYNFYVNGESGKVFGAYPKSWVKILLTVLLGIVIIAGMILLINYLE